MKVNLSSAGTKTLLFITGLAVLGVTVSMSAYSLYFVLRHLGMPRIFAYAIFIAYDGAAIWFGARSLQNAKEGMPSLRPRIWMIGICGISAWVNSLHAVLGHESWMTIPAWSALPIISVGISEELTARARYKAFARMGHAYPAPMPKWSSHNWLLFPLNTLDKFRDIARARSDALASTEGWIPRQLRKARDNAVEAARLKALEEAPEAYFTPANGPEREGTLQEPAGRTAPDGRADERKVPSPEWMPPRSRPAGPFRSNVVPLKGRAAHAPHKKVREWAWAQGHLPREKVRGALPVWIIEKYEREHSGTAVVNHPERTDAPADTERMERTDSPEPGRTEADA